MRVQAAGTLRERCRHNFVYLENLIVANETRRDEEQALMDIYSCFPIKDLEVPLYYLGCRITRDRDASTLDVDHAKFVQAVAQRSGITKTSAIHPGQEERPSPRRNGDRKTLKPTRCDIYPTGKLSEPPCGRQL